MLSVPMIADNLAARIVAILLGSFVILTLAFGAVMLWPQPGDSEAGLFKLPLPQETAAIVEALEATPPAARLKVVQALNTSSVSLHLDTDFPEIPPELARAPGLEALFKGYSDVLQDRPFRVALHRGWLPAFLAIRTINSAAASVQMSIRLRDGAVLVIERRPPALVRTYLARIAVSVGLIALILLTSLAIAVRQTARPVNRLALAVRGFSLDGNTPDLPTGGPRELRQLSSAFNEMQHRIRGLVEDRTRVLGAIAHDLRTYLTRLRLRTEFITDADQRLRAERDIAEMSQLLDDVLLFAENATRPQGTLSLIDLSAETAEFVTMREEMGEAVTLCSPVPSGPLVARCPPIAYRRMLSNLVDNALRYGGAAHVSLAICDGQVQVSVEDDGPGVPQEALAQMIRPFERLENSRARSTGGAGLGLAIVKGLVESVSGDLILANKTQGGLRATLSLVRWIGDR